MDGTQERFSGGANGDNSAKQGTDILTPGREGRGSGGSSWEGIRAWAWELVLRACGCVSCMAYGAQTMFLPEGVRAEPSGTGRAVTETSAHARMASAEKCIMNGNGKFKMGARSGSVVGS